MTDERRYECQVRTIKSMIQSDKWDGRPVMERLRLLFRAEDLTVDPVESRALGWGCTELEARTRLRWWLLRVHAALLKRKAA